MEKVFKMIRPSKFVSGDIAIAKKLIKLVDGTYHIQGQRIRVTDKNRGIL